jgi:curved DNA-binding protein CbpA
MSQRIADPYGALGLPRGASPRQVREAYRRLAKQNHPDLHHDAHAGERMQRINEAWQILSSPARRERYDADARRRAPNNTGRHWTAAPRQARPAAERRAWATAADADMRSGSAPNPVPLIALLIVVPLAAVALTGLIAGVLPLPLLGLMLLITARWLSHLFADAGQ